MMISGHQVIWGLCFWICISKFCEAKAQHSIDDVINPVKSHVDVWQQRKPRVTVKPTEEALCEPQVYYCEVPEGHYLISENLTKACDYRNVQFHEQIYRWVAGRGCLLYTPDFLYKAGYNTLNLNAACYYGNLYGPCLEVKNSDGSCSCYPFDPGLEEVVSAVRDAIIPTAHGRWEQCFYEARDCCTFYMSQEDADEGSTCRATFDGWTCWPDTEGDTVASEVCPDFAYSNARPSCNHYSTKQCYSTGSWEIQTDYSTCSITPRLLLRYRYHVAMLAVSVATCVPAIVIFCFYRRLWVTRVALHRNLLIAIVIRNLAVAVSRGEIYIDELTNSGTTVMSNNGALCRTLATIDRVAGNAVFFFMLMEGVYLHRTIVTVFKKKLKMNLLYAVGAVLIVAPVIAWATIMAVLNDHSCWLVYTVNHIQWVIDVPRIAILLVNLALFVDILRVLLTKIRNSENSNQLNTTKATLFLMPLFGVQFLLTAIRIPTDNCTGEQAYYFIAYTVEALQGSIVAVLYCYNNKEVHQLLKGTYKKTETAVFSIVRPDSSYRRSSFGPKSNRRMTYSTALDLQPHKSYSESPPNLHVAEIVSIQTSERLAEILDPVYESFAGEVNEGYESVESQVIESASEPPEPKPGEEFIYTQTPSSIDGQDWIKCISSAGSSVYSNSLNDDEIKYLENKFPENAKRKSFRQAVKDIINKNKFKWKPSLSETGELEFGTYNSYKVNLEPSENMESIKEHVSETDDDHKGMGEEKWEELEDSDDSMYEAIMQIIQTSGPSNEVDEALNPELLSPNRKEDDKIIFVP